MTALLELKQKIKNLYGQYELYLLPVFKFVLAMLYFTWINENMGYMSSAEQYVCCADPGSDLFYTAICCDSICRIYPDDPSQLCLEPGDCRVYAGTDSGNGDLFP